MMKNKPVVIDWKPDKTSGEPIYKQIVEYMNGRIRQGHFAVGSKIPSQRKLAELFRVNRSTIVMAMEELISYGLLESDFGGGTTVSSNTWSVLMSSPPDWSKYIASGPFKANHPTIQQINKLEFEEGYIRLGTGELSPSLFPKEMICDLMGRLPERISSLNYLGPLGLLELRQELAGYLNRKGIRASESNILITSGSLQALQLISVSMLRAGSVVFTEAPSYLKSLQVFQSAGMKLSGIPMDGEGLEFWHMKGSENSLLYTIPTYQNPSGSVMSKERRRAVLDFCERQRLPVIEDDAYGALWFDEQPPAAIKTMDQTGTVVYLGTISKTLAPGLRIGWVVGPEAVIERMGDIKMQVDYGASSVSQWMVRELLADGKYESYLAALRKKLKARRDIMLESLERYFAELATWTVPKGGFYIWCKLKRPVSMHQVFSEALTKGLLLNPGNIYEFEETYSLRLSYSYIEPKEIDQALKTLSHIIAEKNPPLL